MNDLFLQLNPDLSHADVVISTTAPSGNFSFVATAAAETSGFCFADYERSVLPVMWRINIQVIAMQMGDYKSATSDEDKTLWKSRILESLLRLNEKAQEFKPCELPRDLPAPTEAYRVPNVTGNWCDTLTHDLTCLFLNVPIQTVDTLKIN